MADIRCGILALASSCASVACADARADAHPDVRPDADHEILENQSLCDLRTRADGVQDRLHRLLDEGVVARHQLDTREADVCTCQHATRATCPLSPRRRRDAVGEHAVRGGIAYLGTNGGGIERIDLANSVCLTASAITRALRPLEKLGLVVTERSERDARQSLAKLTPAGTELLEDAKGIFQDALRDLPLHGLKKREIIEFQNRLEEINKSLR